MLENKLTYQMATVQTQYKIRGAIALAQMNSSDDNVNMRTVE